MRTIRIHHPESLSIGAEVALDETACAHLLRVLRLGDGDELELFDGSGLAFDAVLTRCDKKRAFARITDSHEENRESPLVLHLAQGIARGEKMDLTIMKSVELGAVSITPIVTERCGVKLSEDRWDKKVQHWQRVAISACEQCGRNRVPTVHAPQALATWLRQHQGHGIMLDPRADVGIRTLPAIHETTLLVGPEGGLTDAEIRQAQQAGFTGIQFGPRILRTETAAWACMAALQARFGDLA